ncbi:MAG: polysaccharide deacetylase family protein [Gemmatimonadota bacterium]|nr:polysaccharide deacetylase family protein [Gemmatimonadota bacterium]
MAFLSAGSLRDVAAAQSPRAPNSLGRVLVLEYHLIGDHEGLYSVTKEHFRNDLEMLYKAGYRPITVRDLIDKKIDVPAGMSPVVFTFDDASPEQFRYIDKNGTLEIDPASAIGIWLDFAKTHPGWSNRATFCVLPGAAAGHSFFGEKGIQGQKSEWRYKKVKWLADQGFELCNHTLWHANLAKYSDAVVQEQIARGALAIDSAVPGYRVRTFALPQGAWPKNRSLAHQGSWRDPKSGKTISYKFDAILEVGGGASRSPFDPQFDPLRLSRFQVIGGSLEKSLATLEKAGTRYVAGAEPKTAAKR